MWDFIVLHKRLLVDFFLAITSGTAAGLVAGFILMWRQFGLQLAKDDVNRILGMIHDIEDADVALSDAFFNVQYAEQDQADNKRVEGILSQRTEEAMEVFLKIGTQAQYIRAKKYRLLRAYLVLRTKRGINYDWDEIELMGNLHEFAQDINGYIKTRRTPLNWLRWRWRLRREFTKEQKTMLANATTSESPQHWWILWCVHPDKLSSVEKERGINQVNDLVGPGLLSQHNEKYHLTREGWKVAVRILKGKYDIKAGAALD